MNQMFGVNGEWWYAEDWYEVSEAGYSREKWFVESALRSVVNSRLIAHVAESSHSHLFLSPLACPLAA